MATTLIPEEVVFAQGNNLLTDSRLVSKAFGKAHRHVLRDIDHLIQKNKEFASAHFWAYVENQEVGTSRRNLRGYKMTKDGFMLLVMGFTGDKAFAVKISYIEAFNNMQKQINGLNNDLISKFMYALEQEKQSFALASLAARIMRKRRDDKPINIDQIEHYKKELQPLLSGWD